MANKRNLKRKSNDYIYELEDCDLSPDDDCVETPTKIIKIDSDIEDTSETNKSNLQNLSNTEENVSSPDLILISTDEINDSNTNAVNASESGNTKKLEESIQGSMKKENDIMIIQESPCIIDGDETDVNSQNEVQSDVEIIEISDNNMERKESSEIIGNSIPVMLVSDDETVLSINTSQGECEILEGLKVIDQVDSPPKRCGEDDVIINITFKNKSIKEEYECLVLQFFRTFPELEVFSSDLSLHVSRKNDITDSTNISDLKTPKKKHKKKKEKRELFILDTNPSLDIAKMGVRYSSKFSIEKDNPEELATPKKVTHVQICFNCGEAHSLKDCPVAKNYTKINVARQKFMNNKSKVMRYHMEEDQKFSHLKPGVVSDSLRKALGLRKHEYPPYIYRMRVLGYPPGWLEEAKLVRSNLRMFDIDGEQVKGAKKVFRKGLDPDKIVEYPGFNAPLEKGFHDEYKKHNVEPYSKNVGKEFMLKYFEELCDESGDEDSSGESGETTQLKKINMTKEILKKKSSENSPSLTELEKTRREVLSQLNSCTYNKSKLADEKNACEDKDSKNISAGETIQQAVTAVKSSALGTPILKSNSPYSRLPKPDNFMVGVSPVIDFENLPNSTGKYEQMTGVLSKVRDTMKNLGRCTVE